MKNLDGKDTEDRADPPSLQLKIYEKIPIPDLPVIFPHKKLSFRIIDTVRLDVATILGLLAYFINYKFENISSSPGVESTGYPYGVNANQGHEIAKNVVLVIRLIMSAIVLDIIAITALVIYVTRVVLGYKQTRDRYQLLVNRTLYEKTVASGFGSVYFLLDASEQQLYKEAVLAYAIILQAENNEVTAKSVGNDCESFVFKVFNKKIEMPMDKVKSTLSRLGLVTEKSVDDEVVLKAIPCCQAYEILRQRGSECIFILSFPQKFHCTIFSLAFFSVGKMKLEEEDRSPKMKLLHGTILRYFGTGKAGELPISSIFEVVEVDLAKESPEQNLMFEGVYWLAIERHGKTIQVHGGRGCEIIWRLGLLEDRISPGILQQFNQVKLTEKTACLPLSLFAAEEQGFSCSFTGEKKMFVKDLEMKSRYYEADCRILEWMHQAVGASKIKQESAVLLLVSLGSFKLFPTFCCYLLHLLRARKDATQVVANLQRQQVHSRLIACDYLEANIDLMDTLINRVRHLYSMCEVLF
ncbi:hypothetical protein M9H77_36522 [Catharanthus roseus]|uniref:Uncharacterized protein n=1 Tax=Catharanthus roseus TaxID=4058 RepID=A0ACB9ZU84_CATRO|nr:hypothetical protein M9H77_36522 [Catharanthus roseus]